MKHSSASADRTWKNPSVRTSAWLRRKYVRTAAEECGPKSTPSNFMDMLCGQGPSRVAAQSREQPSGSVVSTVKQADGNYKYLVNGREQLFIGMGYDAIYRYLTPEQRAANYRRDFRMLSDAGVTAVLEQEKGHVTRAAERAGLDRKNFWQLMKRHEIKSDDFKASDGTTP